MIQAHQLIGGLAEVLLERRSPAATWPTIVEHLERAVGFDAGYVAATWGSCLEARGAVIGHDEPSLKRRLGWYLSQISPEEIAFYADRAKNYEDVWPRLDRRKELAVFTDLLWPTRMRHMLVRVSARGGNVAGINLERRGLSRPFSERELMLLDTVTPFLHIVELLAVDHAPARKDAFADEYRLTRREAEFAELVSRGLQNREIAILMGVSVNTVRNALVRVFEKVGASNRAELTYFASRSQGEVAVESSRTRDGTEVFRAHLVEVSRSKAAPGVPLDAKRASPPRITYTAPIVE